MKRILKALQRILDQEWRHVPPPNWAAKRGSGRIYW